MGLRRLAEVDGLGVFLSDVAHDLAILAEEQVAVGIQHDALCLERAGRRAVIAVGDHVRVVHVDVVLPVEQRILAHAIEEEPPHRLLLHAHRS